MKITHDLKDTRTVRLSVCKGERMCMFVRVSVICVFAGVCVRVCLTMLVSMCESVDMCVCMCKCLYV